MGYYPPENYPAQSQFFTETFFELPEKTNFGWLPGDFFIIDPEYSGNTRKTFCKKLTFGQSKDAFALIYSLNQLYESGITEKSGITFHAQCYGTLRLINMLYYLSHNEQIKEIENFFCLGGLYGMPIDRIRKEQLLSLLKIISIQTPLRKPIDGPVAIGHHSYVEPLKNKLVQTGFATILAACLFENSQNIRLKIALAGIGIFCLPAILTIQNRLFNLDRKIVHNIFLPYVYNYDPEHISPEKIFQALDYFKQEYPHMSLFVTTAKNDRVVGDWKVDEFFNTFPVNEDRKYLIPSNQFGHCKVSRKQLRAKNAFLKRYGSSYARLPDDQLQEGELILDFAQKGQQTNIKEYITFMESDQNDDVVVSDNH